MLGAALRDVPRESFVVGTKIGRYDTDTFDFSAHRAARSVDESCQRLGLDAVDIVLCHDVEFGDLDLVAKETIPALARLRDSGRVRAVGLSAYPLEALAYVVAAAPPGSVDVVLSYCNYTLQNDRLSLLLPAMQRAGVSVVNASPLSMGLLTKTGGPDWHPAPAHVRTAARKASDLCEARGKSLATLALQYALAAPPPVVSTLVGIADTAMLQMNVAAATQVADATLVDAVHGALGDARGVRWDSGRFLA